MTFMCHCSCYKQPFFLGEISPKNGKKKLSDTCMLNYGMEWRVSSRIPSLEGLTYAISHHCLDWISPAHPHQLRFDFMSPRRLPPPVRLCLAAGWNFSSPPSPFPLGSLNLAPDSIQSLLSVTPNSRLHRSPSFAFFLLHRWVYSPINPLLFNASPFVIAIRPD